MKINKLLDQDVVPSIVELEKLCFPDAPWTDVMLSAVIEAPFRDIFVLSKDGEAIGYAIMQIIVGEGEIERIGVHPQYRGQSLGKKLLFEIFENEILEQCFLEVSEKNNVAYQLYKSCGFAEIGRRQGYYHDGADAIMMKWERTANE